MEWGRPHQMSSIMKNTSAIPPHIMMIDPITITTNNTVSLTVGLPTSGPLPIIRQPSGAVNPPITAHMGGLSVHV